MMIWTMVALLALSLVGAGVAIDNGLGLTPPMGWRSWNCYRGNVSQAKMTLAANAMASRSRGGTSLLDVGFSHCGLDDGWQACEAGVNGSFHNASGYPMPDLSRFPDMRSMTDHAHSLGIQMGWYGNNCHCVEKQAVPSWGPAASPGSDRWHHIHHDGVKHYQGDVQATIDFGFDGIKLDACGEFQNLSYFAELMNATGKPILVEDCHWGQDGPGDWGDGGHLNQGPNRVPQEKWCPFNFFRTSMDIKGTFESIMLNLQTVIKYQPWDDWTAVQTGPGCWAFPDMLEVGNLRTFEADRTHFGAWCIVSAPLILGHDLANNKTNERIWPIITNKAAISVSQSFAVGDAMHPGGLVRSYEPPGAPTQYLYAGATQVAGWSAPPQGGAAGPLKHGGMCVDAAAPHKQFALSACNGSAGQLFTFAANGNLHMAGGNGGCLAVKRGQTAVRMCLNFACNTGDNEELVFDAQATTLCTKSTSRSETKCFYPGPPGGGDNSGNGEIQIWAKPQPGGAVAVLVINAAAAAGNHSVAFNMSEIKYGHSGPSTLLDIWKQESSTIPGSQESFTTDLVAPQDSRFYLFSPQH